MRLEECVICQNRRIHLQYEQRLLIQKAWPTISFLYLIKMFELVQFQLIYENERNSQYESTNHK